MAWIAEVWTWVPLAVLIAFGTIASVRPSPRAIPRLLCGFAMLAGGGLTVAALVYQRDAGTAAQIEATASVRDGLHRVWLHLDKIGQLLPGPSAAGPAASFDNLAGGTAALLAKADELEARVEGFRVAARYRTIDDETAEKMAAFLRPLGRHRVVVSCAPDDVEAYFYANRIATVLRAAGWEALGPETTSVFGHAPSMDVAIYVRGGGAAPEAAAMLLDAFGRFNIPYQGKLAASEAIPDATTVELFVAPRPE